MATYVLLELDGDRPGKNHVLHRGRLNDVQTLSCSTGREGRNNEGGSSSELHDVELWGCGGQKINGIEEGCWSEEID